MTLMSFIVNAQTENHPEMADALRADGKIYVVIGVISIVFICIVVLLIAIEKKLKNLENKINSQK